MRSAVRRPRRRRIEAAEIGNQLGLITPRKSIKLKSHLGDFTLAHGHQANANNAACDLGCMLLTEPQDGANLGAQGRNLIALQEHTAA